MANPTKTLLNIIAETQFGQAIAKKQPIPTTLDLSYMFMPASDITELGQLLTSSETQSTEKIHKSFFGRLVNKIHSFTKTFQKSHIFKEEFLAHKSEITGLNLSKIYYTGDKTEPFNTKSLIELLSIPKLQTLDLSGNEFITTKVAEAIILEAIKHPNIQHLSLKSNKLEADWVSSIVEKLGTVKHPLTIELKTVRIAIADREYNESIFLQNGTLYCNKTELTEESEIDQSDEMDQYQPKFSYGDEDCAPREWIEIMGKTLGPDAEASEA